jgi:type I restriction enzyme R subunit
MQAIARVNRVYKDKPGGLVVDYIGIGQDLRKAMAIYLQSGGQGSPIVDKQFGVIRGAGHYHLDYAFI